MSLDFQLKHNVFQGDELAFFTSPLQVSLPASLPLALGAGRGKEKVSPQDALVAGRQVHTQIQMVLEKMSLSVYLSPLGLSPSLVSQGFLAPCLSDSFSEGLLWPPLSDGFFSPSLAEGVLSPSFAEGVLSPSLSSLLPLSRLLSHLSCLRTHPAPFAFTLSADGFISTFFSSSTVSLGRWL